jgi:superfamily II DNA or RNA helicase
MSSTKTKIQKEALKAILPLHNAGVEISMGVGKTLLGLKHMSEVSKFMDKSKRFLVVAPKVSIFDSWKADAKKHKMSHLLDLIDFTTYLSLEKQGYNYEVIYLDECHSLKYNHEFYLTAAQLQGATIIGLTGTYPRYRSGEKGEMCNKFCPKVYEYKTDEAIDDKILNDYRIYVHMIDLSDKKVVPIKGKNGSTWFVSEQQNYDYWTNQLEGAGKGKNIQMLRILRMKALMGYPSKERYVEQLLARRKTKTLLFANTQDQADRLAPHSYHSNNPKSAENLEKFKSGEIELLSAVEQLSEGVNIPNLKSGIIMHAYSNNRKASQKLGRLLRLNPDDTAGVHILCYRDTVDEAWVKSAIEHFDQEKIVWLN